MNEEERKERVQYLWKRVRRHFWQHVTMLRMQRMTSLKVDVALIDEDELLNDQNQDQNKNEKWYLLDENKTITVIWEFIINTFTMYTLFTTPFIFAFQELYHYMRVLNLINDSFFCIDIVLCFFKTKGENKTLRQIAFHYLRGFFIFDLLSVLPELIIHQSTYSSFYAFRLARFVHTNRLFSLFTTILTKFLLNRGYNKVRVRDSVSLVILVVFIIFSTHLLACFWCFLGRLDYHLPESEKYTWIHTNEGFDEHNVRQIYIFAVYFILQTLTTVGYGDYTGHTRYEYIFSMVLEFIGLTFFSFLMGSINNMLKKQDNFESLIDEKLSLLDIWIKKIEKSNKPYFIPPELYSNIKQYVQDAFLHDFNLIIEEFSFYQQIPPKMQSEIMNTIFKDFQQNFKHFFDYCEKGFANELIINMYCRIYSPDSQVVTYGQKFREIYFIREGGVSLYNKYQIQDFMYLPQYSVFGDYQVLCDLKSNIVFKTAKKNSDIRFMCVSKKVFLNLCDLFPITAENLKQRALEKRLHYLRAMEKLDQNSIYKGLKRSLNKKIQNQITEKIGQQIQEFQIGDGRQSSKQVTEKIQDLDSYLDDLEMFQSDEDDSGKSNEENAKSIIKSVSQKTSRILRALATCEEKMEVNAQLIKRYLQKGRQPDSEFRRKILNISENFREVAQIKVEPEEAEEEKRLQVLRFLTSKINKIQQSQSPSPQKDREREDNEQDKTKMEEDEQIIEQTLLEYEQKDSEPSINHD